MTTTPNTGPRYPEPSERPDFDLRNTEEGLHLQMVSHEDGTRTITSVITRSLRDVFPVDIEQVVDIDNSTIDNVGGNE